MNPLLRKRAVAKYKRKSSRIKVSRETMRQAQYAKRVGLLSPRAKTSGGTLSRSVIKRVDALDALRAVPQYEFRAGSSKPTVLNAPKRSKVKYSPAMAKTARERGYNVFNGHVITSDVERTLKARSERRIAAASIERDERGFPEGPVKQRVELRRHKIRNFKQLMDALDNGDLERVVKGKNEWYTFKLFDLETNPYRHGVMGSNGNFEIFANDAELRDYLQKYKSIMDGIEKDEDAVLFDNFELLLVDNTYVPDRKGGRDKYFKRFPQERRMLYYKVRTRAKVEKKALQTNIERRERDRLRHHAMREQMTPSQRETYLAEARARMNRNRNK